MTDFWDRDGQPLGDVLSWAALYEGGRRNVARTQVDHEVMVSTVWVGHDLGFGLLRPAGPDRRPLIFETMIFGGPLHHERWNWPTLDDAIVGHDMVAHLAHLYSTGALGPEPEAGP